MESFDQTSFLPLSEQDNINLSSSLEAFWSAQSGLRLSIGDDQQQAIVPDQVPLEWPDFSFASLNLPHRELDFPESPQMSPLSSPSSESDSKDALNTTAIKLEQVDQLAAAFQLPPSILTPNTEDFVGPMRHTKSSRGLKGESGEVAPLSREQLLQMTSDELEDYVKELAATRPLTAAEKKEFKKFRRLVKNRESAQQSRRRKRERIDELELKLDGLSKTNTKLETQVNDLIAENKILCAEVNQLVSVIKDSPVLSSMLLNITSLVVLYSMAQQMPPSKSHQTVPLLIPQTPTTVSVC